MLDSLLKLFGRTPQLDEENFAPGRFNDFQGLFDKAALNATIKGKGKNQAIQISCHCLSEYHQPNLLSQLNERQATELEERLNQINHQVIMENFKAGELR